MSRRTVRDVMRKDVVTAGADTPYRRIVDLLQAGGTGAVPVLDAAGVVVGVVSEADVLHKIELAGRARPSVFRRRPGASRGRAATRDASDLMSNPAYVVGAGAPLVEAAEMMDARRVRWLPVVDDTGRPVGILSRTDVLGALLSDDERIRRQVEREVVRVVLWATPDEVHVEVTGGVVRLTGVVERRSLVPVADRLTRAVDGVVDVVNDLEFDIDDRDVGPPPPLGDVRDRYWAPSRTR